MFASTYVSSSSSSSSSSPWWGWPSHHTTTPQNMNKIRVSLIVWVLHVRRCCCFMVILIAQVRRWARPPLHSTLTLTSTTAIQYPMRTIQSLSELNWATRLDSSSFLCSSCCAYFFLFQKWKEWKRKTWTRKERTTTTTCATHPNPSNALRTHRRNGRSNTDATTYK